MHFFAARDRPNSAGKSTIVQALHYAYEIFEQNNLDPGSTSKGGHSIDLGGFESLVYNHDLSKSVNLKFELDLMNEDLPQYFEGYEEIGIDRFSYENIWAIPAKAYSASVEISIKWSPIINAPLLNSYRVMINDEALIHIQTSDDGKQVFLVNINPFNPVFLEGVTPEQAYQIVLNTLSGVDSDNNDFNKLGPILPLLMTNFKVENGVAGITAPIGIMAKDSALPKFGKPIEFHWDSWVEDNDIIEQGNFTMCMSSLIVGPGELIRDNLRKLSYIGPIREIPPRNYIPEKSPDIARWSSGIMGWDILHKSDTEFIKKLNQWLTHQDGFNCGYRIEVNKFREIDLDDPVMLLMSEGIGLEEMEMIQTKVANIPVKSRVTLREEKTGIKLMPQDIGIGISQSLPIIIAALYLKEGILAIEQPELHIHPALQVVMGDLFISQIQDKNISFLLETHSEHLMLRLLRRIRETREEELPPGKDPINPDQLAVYFMEHSQTGIIAIPIRVNDEGEFIDKWPQGFFSERMKELFKMIYEYALDPELVVQWCDRKKYLFFEEKFGVRSRRIPSAYPKKEWRKLIWEAFYKSPYSDDQNAQTKITELVHNLWQNSIKRPSTFPEIKDWLERTKKEHEERPFHAILSTKNPGNKECVIEVKKLLENGHSSWAIPDINSTLRNPEEIANAVAPIFKICRHALLIDPYFDPNKERFCQTLEAFLNRCNNNVCGIDCFILEIHTAIDRFFENWEKHKNRDPIKEKNVYENFIADCKKRLPNYIPEKTQIKIIVWKEKENGEKLHNRYLLTDMFGVLFGTGSDSADNPGSKESDDIVLLDEKQYQNRFKQYSNSAPAFDMVGKAFIISSPA